MFFGYISTDGDDEYTYRSVCYGTPLSPSYHHRHGEREMREFVDYIITNYLQGSIQQSR